MTLLSLAPSQGLFQDRRHRHGQGGHLEAVEERPLQDGDQPLRRRRQLDGAQGGHLRRRHDGRRVQPRANPAQGHQ